MPNGLPESSPNMRYRSQSEGMFNIEYYLVTKQALDRSNQNFVTKFNHIPHLACGLWYDYMPSGLPQTQSQGAHRSKSDVMFAIKY